jgi:CDP-paratose 2-epimerase
VTTVPLSARTGHALITGGAGFIGSNVAARLLSLGQRVVLLDNLSRPGVERNVSWLRDTYGDGVTLVRADCRDARAVAEQVRGANQVFHFAAQVAVTTSLVNPLGDFEVNARGTLNVLEALRRLPEPAPLVFTSTNKVYGALDDVPLAVSETRYEPSDGELRRCGVSEARQLDFHSPYGCSKGTADQYVIDYARSFGLPAAVFRMSCIYGPRQFGTEDQGWVAHFLIQALAGESITIYGDGKQVRDILFIDDLVDAFLLAQSNMRRVAGRAFNIGGGARNTVSLCELLQRIERLTGKRPATDWQSWRVGDQRYYVSDFKRFSEASGWSPRVGVADGLERLQRWLLDERASRGPAPAKYSRYAERGVLRPGAA